ncbi:hypothetical protein ABZ069_23130 [Streptomyces microflavus]|uniref:hypothetical protein n=1 Tax=Streptomyces microflavus TaxID=1919 RepID=UPI00339F7B26
MTNYLSAEQILDADDLKIEDVPVPEWGGTVRVKGMSGTERDRFEAGFIGGDMKQLPPDKALEYYRARIAAACLVDQAGKKMFRSVGEVKRLSDKNAEALQRVVDVANRLSGLTEEDVEELTGNSAAAPSGSSTSDSPDTSDSPSPSSSGGSARASSRSGKQ